MQIFALTSCEFFKNMSHKFFDLTFTESVKAAQEKYGSRNHYARSEGGEPDFYRLTDSERLFIGERDGFYMATVNQDLQPYIQFRGGKKGFLKVLDDRTLGFADFRGNLQYVSVGNLKVNHKAALFLMDYASKSRLKILAEIEVLDAAEAPEIIEELADKDYKAKVERAMVLHVKAFDWNCQQHITERYTLSEINAISAPLHNRIETLEAEIKRLRGEE